MKKTLIITAIFFLTSVLYSEILIAQVSKICITCGGNSVTGASSSALGVDNNVSGAKSTAIGYNNNISSLGSFIAGSYSTILSNNSTIIGGISTINDGCSESFIFGEGSIARNTQVMLIGHRLRSSAGNQILLGMGPVGGYFTSDKMYSFSVGFNSSVPTFFVSDTPSGQESGNVSIGNNTNPQAKLHIRADANENATMMLEATGTNKTCNFLMSGGQAAIGTASPNHSLSFVTGTSTTRMIINGTTGNIGIGNNTNPQAKLHIRASTNEQATMMLEATGTNKTCNFLMSGGQAVIGTASSNHSLSFVTGASTTRMIINGTTGNIGIGNNINPQARLHVSAGNTQSADILLDASGTNQSAGIYFSGSGVNIGTFEKDKSISFYTAATDLKMQIDPQGNVGIGISSPQYKLHVAGGAKFTDKVFVDAGGLYVNGEVKAKKFHASISPWPDFVFNSNYKLMPLMEVKKYIEDHGHLPGLPEAGTVENDGIELGEMNALLLQKIEELYLYSIEQEKKIQALETTIRSLQ
jgi:hypothetical protein